MAFYASANGHSRRRRLTWPRNATSQGTSVNSNSVRRTATPAQSRTIGALDFVCKNSQGLSALVWKVANGPFGDNAIDEFARKSPMSTGSPFAAAGAAGACLGEVSSKACIRTILPGSQSGSSDRAGAADRREGEIWGQAARLSASPHVRLVMPSAGIKSG